ncbi:MAG TPA: hypothetical protein PJ990_10840 [Saprospiraceae bacterium]|nr:hypothetical protein [Saprospiraceae bacterium]
MAKLKHVFLIFILTISLTNISFGQAENKAVEVSNAEKFSDKTGALMKKEFSDIGEIKRCKIQIAKFTDLITDQKNIAVRFEYNYVSTYSSDSKIALLDVDEIDGLIQSLNLIQEKVLPTSTKNYTEVSYRSRSGFEAGCFSKKDSWSIYLKLERYDGDSYVFLNKDDLPKLLDLISVAKSNLQ